MKNGLVFVPLATVHRAFEVNLVQRALLAFVAFNLCASGLYLLNDLLDLPADRRHPSKKERMLASGRIRLAHALVMMPILLLGAFVVALHQSVSFARVLGPLHRGFRCRKTIRPPIRYFYESKLILRTSLCIYWRTKRPQRRLNYTGVALSIAHNA